MTVLRPELMCNLIINGRRDIHDEESKRVRGMTGLPLDECVKAFEECGDILNAVEYLRKKWQGVWKTAK